MNDTTEYPHCWRGAMRKVLLAICISVVANVMPLAQSIADEKFDLLIDGIKGVKAYEKGDYATAVKKLRPGAEQGNPRFQNFLGMMYDKGQGVARNYSEAVKWYRKAAEQDYADAQYNLGLKYEMGEGVSQNLDEAFKLYEAAAENSNTAAQYALGLKYASGQGLPKSFPPLAAFWFRVAAERGHIGALERLREEANSGNMYAQFNLGSLYAKGIDQAERDSGRVTRSEKNYTEARKWFQTAAENGHDGAQYQLGLIYFDGLGVPQDYTEAAKWHRKAAEQDYADAQYNLGLMYEQNQGVSLNIVEAHKWFNLASANGHKGARFNRDRIAKEMTSDKITEAQKLAREWKPKK